MSAEAGKRLVRRERQTLGELAATEILNLIMRGEIPPGAPLRLAELAEQLDMSHMPVREGLQRLGTLGIVEMIPHRGARVRELSLEDLDDTQRTRLSLESIAIEMAASRFTAEDADIARRALDATLAFAQDHNALEARSAHADFHFALYRASGSRWLIKAIEPVWGNSERYRFAGSTSTERVVQSHREHEALLEACIARDSTAAVSALHHHLTSAAGRIRATVEARIEAMGQQ
ncbi:GntR family transcriptional regulator [Aeromicrobium sp. Sec7.5]|uniref:GntR family transcriptional regulator n=1 Tax=Aeromicrobium sp. Sec7.5 TaxID=3121276 RepID=UPI002FE4A2E8